MVLGLGFVEFDLEKYLLVRAEHGLELVKFLTELVERRGITVAAFTVIGAVRRATLGFYDQGKHEYCEIMVEDPHEIASCEGNVSLKNGKAYVHAHAVLSGRTGNTIGGHLIEATVFAAEIHLRELKGVKLERKHDDKTGLFLWKIE